MNNDWFEKSSNIEGDSEIGAGVPPRNAPYIVCAAIKSGGDIIAGPRHYDSIMHHQIRLSTKHLIPEDARKAWVAAEQGFIDQFGKFYTRQEAWDVAESNGQIKYNLAIQDGVLYSEHLY
jgi:hypothetical protein